MSNTTQVEASSHVKENYMVYAMSTIIDRALPDVRDSLKPVHRRLLYSMYSKGMTYNKPRFKSSAPVAETMKIHHHGDSSIYGSLALMERDNGTLLHPFIDGDGSFGRVYSKDSPSAARYTSCRLNKFSEEFFQNINKDIIHMIGEDDEHIQPSILPVTYPAILVKPNEGIAVGEACKFGSFNLNEVIDATIAYIKDENIDVLEYLLAPDFSTGGKLIYNKTELSKIYDTGKGKVVLRGNYKYDKVNNYIEIYEIPYSTTVEDIVSSISDLMKLSEFKEILDVRDETGYNIELDKDQLKITIDIKKTANVDLLMKKLFKRSPLEKAFSFNMNCLVDYKPRVLGVKELLGHWLTFRRECVEKALSHDIKLKNKQLHLLKGLEKVLIDIDKAIKTIRESSEKEVLNKLAKEFNIDVVQAENIANMKLRNINKDYIIKKIKDINDFEQEIETLKYQLDTPKEIDKIIVSELERVRKEYGQTRKTEIVYEDTIKEISETELIDDYSCNIVYTKENYLKKTLRYSESQKVKDGDIVVSMTQASNRGEVILISNKQNAYKLQINDLDSKQPSAIGMYIPNLIKLEEDENVIGSIATSNYKGYAIITYENGKIHKLPLEAFKTSTKRSMLRNTTINERIVSIIQIEEDSDIYLESSQNKAMVINTSNINSKSSRTANGITIMSSNKDDFKVTKAELFKEQVDKNNYMVSKKSSGFKLQ